MRPTKGDAGYRDSLIKHYASEANAPKRRLMELRDSLMSTPGCTKKAHRSRQWYCRHYKAWDKNGVAIYTPKGRVLVNYDPPSVALYDRNGHKFDFVAKYLLNKRTIYDVLALLREFPDTLERGDIGAK